jgi:hypothetical protein
MKEEEEEGKGTKIRVTREGWKSGQEMKMKDETVGKERQKVGEGKDAREGNSRDGRTPQH